VRAWEGREDPLQSSSKRNTKKLRTTRSTRLHIEQRARTKVTVGQRLVYPVHFPCQDDWLGFEPSFFSWLMVCLAPGGHLLSHLQRRLLTAQHASSLTSPMTSCRPRQAHSTELFTLPGWGKRLQDESGANVSAGRRVGGMALRVHTGRDARFKNANTTKKKKKSVLGWSGAE
jgi:hypothetical protein